MDSTKIALLSGTLFGAGLAVAQMTNPAKVIGFLDITGRWDPTLGLVIGGALVVSTLAQQVDRRRRRRQGQASPETSGRIDAPLLIGSTLFGIGWGLAGFCPGPALTALITGSFEVLLFVLSMAAGMALFRVTGWARPKEGSRVQDSIA